MGGVNMTDMQVMQDSFSCQWMIDLSSNNNNDRWSWIPRHYFKFFGNDLACFNTTIGPSCFKGINQIKSEFWLSVAKAWLKNNKIKTPTIANETCIWNNPLIIYQNQVLHFREWSCKGIMKIRDLLIENVRLMTFEQIQAAVGVSPGLYLQYVVVYNAVQSFLRSCPLDNQTVDENSKMPLILNNKPSRKVRDLRKNISESKYSEPCAIKFWKNNFVIEINNENWKMPSITTSEIRLRELQWKILHNIYPTHILLNKMGKVTSPNCPYCPNKRDFIEHFFLECKKINQLWKHVETIYNARFGKRIPISMTDVLTGKRQLFRY